MAVDDISDGRVMIEATRNDPMAQKSTSYHMVLKPTGIEMYPVVVRYAWPSELDLMARLAGLKLHDRWGSYSRGPFTSDSQSHVSVYGRG
jgi:hypothetical protein